MRLLNYFEQYIDLEYEDYNWNNRPYETHSVIIFV